MILQDRINQIEAKELRLISDEELLEEIRARITRNYLDKKSFFLRELKDEVNTCVKL